MRGKALSVFYGQPVRAIVSANQITPPTDVKHNKDLKDIKPAKTVNDEPGTLKVLTSKIDGINLSKQPSSSKQVTQGTLHLQDLIRTSIQNTKRVFKDEQSINGRTELRASYDENNEGTDP